MPQGHLISVDELRALGWLDCPPGFRESLGGKTRAKKPERDLFSDVKDEVPEVVAEDEVEEDDDSEETDPDDAPS